MIAVTVRHDDIFDLIGIKPELSQAPFDVLLRFARIIQRIQNNDAVGCGQRPRRHIRNAKEVQIVENLRGLRTGNH